MLKGAVAGEKEKVMNVFFFFAFCRQHGRKRKKRDDNNNGVQVAIKNQQYCPKPQSTQLPPPTARQAARAAMPAELAWYGIVGYICAARART